MKNPVLSSAEKDQMATKLSRCYWLWTTIQRAFDERLLIGEVYNAAENDLETKAYIAVASG